MALSDSTMMYTVRIRHKPTGEIRECGPNEFDSEQQAIWCYSEGNYSCDCNRAGFFRDDTITDYRCGNGEYSVELRYNERVVWSDFA